MDWYAVEAHEGKDNDACLRLASAGLHVWRPLDARQDARRDGAGSRIRRGRAPIEKRPARQDRHIARFGRYFFVEVELTRSLLREIERVSGARMLRPAGEEMPVPVPREQIASLVKT